jgi:signal transduction histidine kinase
MKLSDTVRTLSDGDEAAEPDPLSIRANKLELLERLSDSLAHEIKNPLHSMVINLEVLKRRLARPAAEGADVLRYATVLGEELERVNRRVDLLLRLTRPERGGPEETTLNEVVDEVMELVDLEARHRGATVDYASTGAMVRVRLGRQQARQILLDLVLDALEGAGEGDSLRVRVHGGTGSARLVVDGAASPGSERTAVAAALAESAGGSVAVEGSVRTLELPAVPRSGLSDSAAMG